MTSLNPRKRKKTLHTGHQYQSIPLELKIPKLQAIRIQCYQNHIVPTLYIYKYTRFVSTLLSGHKRSQMVCGQTSYTLLPNVLLPMV